MEWPTKMECGREVIDGERLGELELVFHITTAQGELELTFSVDPAELDRQPVSALAELARLDAIDLISSARYELRELETP